MAYKKQSVTKKRKPIQRVRLPIGGRRTVTLTWKVSVKGKLTKKQQAARSKRQKQISLFLLLFGIVGIIYFGFKTVVAATPDYTASPATLITPRRTMNTTSLPAAIPTHVTVSDIGINADISQVNRLSDGSLEVPSSGEIVGYYGQGPTPGEIGPAVLVGHVDTYTGPAVFARVHELKAGQHISVTRQDGTIAVFRVTHLQSYSQDVFPTEIVYGNINYAGLRLITCGGTFNVLGQRYSHNTVVFAELVN